MSMDRNYIIGSFSYLAACCNEIQFPYTCRKCDKEMGCYYCDFNYDKAHKCDE